MPLINSIISWFNVKRMHQIDLFKKYPGNVQNEMFNKLISQAAGTEWGKKYKYREIETIKQYQARIPLQTYEDILPYVERQRAGEQNILWPTEIKWYAKSSGTTAEKSKFIPVSTEALEECHFRGSKDIMALYTHQFPDSIVLRGKSLTLGGSHQINNYSTKSYYGDLSAILIENLPFWANFIRTPSAEIALIPNFEEKVKKITQIAVKENVTNIAGVPSWNLVLLKHILDATGSDNLLEIWPNLELFTHGGVSFAPYKEQFQRIIPSPKMNYLETYNASEGFFGIQDDLTDSAMLLMLDYEVFYEFIPMKKFYEPNPPVYTIEEVEKDINYAIVISTNGGLWRYVIGDTITFTSLYPHKFKITGRTKYFINTFGEEVILENAENALMNACKHANAEIGDYTAGPIYMDEEAKGSHEWLIEFEKEPSDLEFFTDILDKSLCSFNSDYEAKRYKNTTLVKPTVRAVPKGTFYQWFQTKGKVGGQNKMPRLSNDRKYIEEIMQLI